MSETKHEHGFLSAMNPKSAFFLGLGGALVLFFVVGFFVLLGVVLKGKDGGLFVRGSGNSAPQAPTVTAPGQPPVADEGVSAERMRPVSDQDWVKGDRGAKVSIVEYSDTECPFCKRHHPTLQQLVAEYGGKVSWVYRHFPLTNLHSKAAKEAEATECAGELGGNEGFWKYLDRLMEVTPANNGLDLAELPKIAEYVGLNQALFEQCLNSGKYAGKVQEHLNEATTAGGTGTPYNVIVSGDRKIPVSGAVSLESLKQVIDSLLST